VTERSAVQDSAGLPSAAKPRRFEELQVLRGYAASMVVIVHSIAAWRPLTDTDRLSGAIVSVLLVPISGRAPVILFFVLSGFVLTHSLLGYRDGPDRAFTFYVRRLFRIMPIAIGGLLIMMLAAEFARQAVPMWKSLPLAAFVDVFDQARIEYLPSSLLIWDDGVNPAYWTLHVELVGSLVMPALIWVTQLSGGRKKLEMLALLALLGLALPFVPVRLGPLSHMSSMTLFCFPLGVLVYFAYLAGLRYRSFQALIAAILLIFAHAVIGPTTRLGSLLGNLEALTPIMGSDNNLALYAQHLFEGLGAAVMVGTLAAVRSSPRFLSGRLAMFIGRISYSLYIVHLPVLVTFIVVFYLSGVATALIAPIFIIAMCVIGVFIGSVLVAWLTYSFIEQPVNTFGKRFKGFSRLVLVAAAGDVP
jgi:peptidoglycan/LPS O-acetylase OafA/YrhL